MKQAREQNPDLIRQAEDSAANPADLEAGLRLAESYMNAGLLYPAYEVYQRLRAAAEPCAEIELGLAAIWDKWRDYSLARTHAEYALQINPQSHEAWNLMGRIHLHRGDFQAAAAGFEKALSLHQADAVLFANAGYTCLRLGRLDRAQAYLEKALSLDGTIAEAHNHLGIVLARRGQYDLAFTHFNQTCEPAAALANLGTVCLEQGRREEARKYFEQALALEPGRREEARKYSEQALALEPENQKARAHLREVENLAVPPSRVTITDSGIAVVAETRADLPLEGPALPEFVTHPSRVSISIAPVPPPLPLPARSDMVGLDLERVDIEKEMQTGAVVLGRDAYQVTDPRAAERPAATERTAPFLYLPVLPPSLQSVADLALEDLPAQAPSRLTGPAGPGLSRSGANLKVTALRWQETLFNHVALADMSLGGPSSPHSDQPDRLYVPSGVSLLLSGLFAIAVVIGLLLAGSLGAVVGFSLVLLGVLAGLMVV